MDSSFRWNDENGIAWRRRLPYMRRHSRSQAGKRFGAVAQLGERCNGIAEVRGSIPLGSTSLAEGYDWKVVESGGGSAIMSHGWRAAMADSCDGGGRRRLHRHFRDPTLAVSRERGSAAGKPAGFRCGAASDGCVIVSARAIVVRAPAAGRVGRGPAVLE